MTEELAAAMLTTGSAWVLPVPDADQGPSPSLFVARTCTSYSVLALRPMMAAVRPVTFCGPSVQSVVPLCR